ncbi:MAG: hypothetical protein QOE97_2863 [Pseudonocardiales bacterium]|jgi:hypothetical protein|nr:hypothetical protein [Pseudonocardiales bacterium]
MVPAMRRSVALSLALALLVPSCRFSKVDSNATVTITGRAVDTAGRPLADRTVLLFKEGDVADLVLGVVFTVGTLGGICLLPQAPVVCRKARTATTDGAGNYRFEISGRDTQGLIGTESTLDVVVADSTPNGASTTVTFAVRETSVALPDARLWDAAARVTEAAGRIRLSWTALPAGAGSKAAFTAQLFDPQRQAAVWSQPAKGSAADVDARLLEDHSGAAAVSARTSLSGQGAADVHGVYLSPRVAVRPIAGAPPSRGRACLAVTGTATLATAPQNPCRATDGDLLTPARLIAAPGTKGTVVDGAVVDLGSSRRVQLVVGRGLSGQVLVELSDDGRTYRTIATGTGVTTAVSPPGAPTARFVRLRSPSGLDESLLSEVSVW